jgi:ABC-type branched-subunit amino acid transport system substrate-binding protein
MILILLTMLIFFGYYSYVKSKPLKVGVILPLSGPLYIGMEKSAIWATELINENGGIGGRPIEIEFIDHYQFYKLRNSSNENEWLQMYRNNMERILDTSDAKIYVGYGGLNGNLFIEKKKIIISPIETPSSVFRKFGKRGYWWRTCLGDVSQVNVIVDILAKKNVSSLSLIYMDNDYGKTFYEWIGFFAMEKGIEILDLAPYTMFDNVTNAVKTIVKNDPEYVLIAADTEDFIRMKKEFNRLGFTSKFFFADQLYSPYLIEQLGKEAEGYEGVAGTLDPSSGFETEYVKRFGIPPPNYSAHLFDAVMLAAYTLARQETTFFEDIATSMNKIVYGRDEEVKWNESIKGISMILNGSLPDISGASGPLDFDMEFGVEPASGFYDHWIVKNGSFISKEILNSKHSSVGFGQKDSSAARSKGSMNKSQIFNETLREDLLPEKKNSWAVIVAASNTWPEYRHQADALAMYDLLKSNGFDDEHIVLMIYDDIPWLDKNKFKGDVHHILNGKNLRSGVSIDYSGNEVKPENLKNILLNEIRSDINSNVFLYIVDHGSPEKIHFVNNQFLSSNDLKEIIELMHDQKKYRKLFVMVDTCFGESIALNISTPNMIYFTGSSKSEPSFGTIYDPQIKQWISDEFTSKVIPLMKKNNSISIFKLYKESYKSVVGSHVRLLNYENFGKLDTQIKEFISP